MTVQKDLVKNIYIGNGSTTQFPITFDVNAEQPGYIHVYISNDDNSTTETENYTVDLISKIVTYPKSGEPLASGKKLVIMRELPLMQLMDLINQGDYYADDVEQAFDDLTMIAQQLSEKLARAMVFSVEVDTANFSNIIPLAPGMSFRINDEGTGLELTEDPAEVLSIAENLLQQTKQQANIATEQASIATNKANAAAESAVSAATSETNAANSEDKAQAWAESETSPDGEDDADSPTGDTMSSKEWALYAKQLTQQIGNPVSNVTENNGTVTVIKADGTVNNFKIVKSVNGVSPDAKGDVHINMDYLPLSGGALTGALTLNNVKLDGQGTKNLYINDELIYNADVNNNNRKGLELPPRSMDKHGGSLLLKPYTGYASAQLDVYDNMARIIGRNYNVDTLSGELTNLWNFPLKTFDTPTDISVEGVIGKNTNYIKYINGLLIQIFTQNNVNSGTWITFPLPFKDTNYAVSLIGHDSNGYQHDATLMELATTGVKVYSSVSQGNIFKIIAIGYAF